MNVKETTVREWLDWLPTTDEELEREYTKEEKDEMLARSRNLFDDLNERELTALGVDVIGELAKVNIKRAYLLVQCMDEMIREEAGRQILLRLRDSLNSAFEGDPEDAEIP